MVCLPGYILLKSIQMGEMHSKDMPLKVYTAQQTRLPGALRAEWGRSSSSKAFQCGSLGQVNLLGLIVTDQTYVSRWCEHVQCEVGLHV